MDLLRDRAFRRHMSIVRDKWWMYALVIGSQIGQTGLSILGAEALRRLFDHLPNLPPGLLNGVLIALVAVIALRLTFSYLEAWFGSLLNESVVYALRRDLLNHLQHLPLGYHESKHSSEAMNVFWNDLETAKDFVVADVQRLIALPISFIFAGFYMLSVNPALGAVALLIGPLQLLSNFVLKDRFQEAVRLQRQVSRDVFHTIGETMHGVREVKANRMEQQVDEQMAEIQGRGVAYNVLRSKTTALRAIARQVPRELGQVVGISLGVGLVASGKIGPGSLVAFISLLDRVAAPFTTMVEVISNLQQAVEGTARLYETLDLPPERKDVGDPLPVTPPTIAFEHVDFAYNVDRPIIRDVSFEIPAGSSLALVGPSGSGKSTLVKLLYRFYEPTSGTVRIDGRPLTDYRIDSLRDRLALVSQDIFLFDATVAKNIAAGLPHATPEEIQRAAELAQADEFIQNLPNGYDSDIGERGIKLSHGQKQRLSIARAILRDASVLVLDEPTSALDVETEASFQRDLGRWAEHCTKIIIAHRLTTIRDCDLVLFLEDGAAVEFGTPSQLLNRQGRFATYWRRQTEITVTL
ncbi:HlyB/MsbA family ABC transporter [Fimbriimonas ginsengisoli Gsoil 348]|uniref:HlyB/MsbA family ABC transporter n=2 Tax=Fimbriimonas ginsengisoli TaxID=1005039 RepID=A0A068NVU3_FIMGI|nr:HlyB/MsbA family ABC transporter [Fimbriimonas ginsengisoli Gsoil 348]